MARKTNMRLLGVVENMSFRAGSGEQLFGSGGGDDARGREVEATAPRAHPVRSAARGAMRTRASRWSLAEPEAEVSQAIVGLAETIDATKREQGVGIVKPLPLVSA